MDVEELVSAGGWIIYDSALALLAVFAAAELGYLSIDVTNGVIGTVVAASALFELFKQALIN